jgi:hypothetical protein
VTHRQGAFWLMHDLLLEHQDGCGRFPGADLWLTSTGSGRICARCRRRGVADDVTRPAPAELRTPRRSSSTAAAIEQGETQFEGVRWVTPQQIAANQVIPLPEPARPGLVNAALMLLQRPTRLWLQPLTFSPLNLLRAWEQTVLGVSAEPPQIARFRSISRTEEAHHDEPNHIGNRWRWNRRGTAHLGTRMPRDRSCAGVVDQSTRRQIRGPGSAMVCRPTTEESPGSMHRS